MDSAIDLSHHTEWYFLTSVCKHKYYFPNGGSLIFFEKISDDFSIEIVKFYHALDIHNYHEVLCHYYWSYLCVIYQTSFKLIIIYWNWIFIGCYWHLIWFSNILVLISPCTQVCAPVKIGTILFSEYEQFWFNCLNTQTANLPVMDM